MTTTKHLLNRVNSIIENSEGDTLTEIKVVTLNNPKMIFPSFKNAYDDKKSFSYLFIEHGDYYNQK